MSELRTWVPKSLIILVLCLSCGGVHGSFNGSMSDSANWRPRRWTFGGPPFFDANSPTNHTAQIGNHAYLPCKVRNIGNKSVSWIRSRDSHILTIDRYTFIADERFSAWYDMSTQSWTLQIKYIQERDGGDYECQISTEPKMSHFIELILVKPYVEIQSGDLYVKSGSQVSVECIVHNSLEEPQYIFWYHDGRRLVGEDRFLLKVIRQPPLTTVGSLVIEDALNLHSGNYTCEPAGLRNATVTLHVLAEEQPAAMQHEISTSGNGRFEPFWSLCFMMLLNCLHSVSWLNGGNRFNGIKNLKTSFSFQYLLHDVM